MQNQRQVCELPDSLTPLSYFRLAAGEFSSLRNLVFAALIVAMRVLVKAFQIPLAAGLSITFDCYVNALGSLVYGPLVGLLVGAVSDTLGCIFFPAGTYFLPFILTEMLSSFIFGLFLWRKKLTVLRVLLAKFTVNLVCNILLTSLLMKWMYYWYYGDEKAASYSLINLVRVGKNLVLFPVESVLIVFVLGAFLPALRSLHMVPENQGSLLLKKRHILLVILLTLLSVGLILLYIFWGKDFLSHHNIKLL